MAEVAAFTAAAVASTAEADFMAEVFMEAASTGAGFHGGGFHGGGVAFHGGGFHGGGFHGGGFHHGGFQGGGFHFAHRRPFHGALLLIRSVLLIIGDNLLASYCRVVLTYYGPRLVSAAIITMWRRRSLASPPLAPRDHRHYW